MNDYVRGDGKKRGRVEDIGELKCRLDSSISTTQCIWETA